MDEAVLIPGGELVVQAGEQLRDGPQHAPGRAEQAAEERRASPPPAARAEQMTAEMLDQLGRLELAVAEQEAEGAAPQRGGTVGVRDELAEAGPPRRAGGRDRRRASGRSVAPRARHRSTGNSSASAVAASDGMR